MGFQGQSLFQASLLGNYLLTWGMDCLWEKPGTQWKSCDSEPVNADLYFDSTLYATPQTESYTATYAGYETSGRVFGAEICLSAANSPFFCSIYN